MTQKQIDLIEQKFTNMFPERFTDPTWQKMGKRHSATPIFKIFQEFLTKEELELTLESGDYEETIDACLRAVKKVSVISVFEKIAFQNFIAHPEIHEDFIEALYQFMYNFSEESFDQFVITLLRYRHEKNSNPAKWPVVSFFKAYDDPDNFIFVKPTTVKGIARVMDWDIQYKSMPNFQTYTNILEMVRSFRAASTICKDQDLMLTQAVMYCAVEL